ncbi:MAG: serine/threonine protein phosphatase [Treponema sp.]|nr:serine/threonine protein phosphatase [Treponema sp.]
MAETNFFNDLSSRHLTPDAVLDISGGGKAFIISDLHMGAGRRDDLAENGGLLISLLEHYYFANDWHLILNGDIEELHRHPLEHIEKRWKDLFRVFNLFNKYNRLYKLVGNHDDELLLKRAYHYPLYSVIQIDTGVIPAYVYHGHQSSVIYRNFNKLMGAGIRYVLKPFGIKNISSGRSPHRRYFVEKAAYNFSLNNDCISIIGHTHRPLFESLGRFDYIKFEIERLCLDYPAAAAEDRERIEAEVKMLRRELSKLKRKERRDVLRHSLYGDELPVPCLFNSGCAIGKKGLTAIEIGSEDIALVYWYTDDRGRSFVSRGGFTTEKLPGTTCNRVVLNHNRLDYIRSKIKLLGK